MDLCIYTYLHTLLYRKAYVCGVRALRGTGTAKWNAAKAPLPHCVDVEQVSSGVTFLVLVVEVMVPHMRHCRHSVSAALVVIVDCLDLEEVSLTGFSPAVGSTLGVRP